MNIFLSYIAKIFLTSLQKTKEILKQEINHHQVYIESLFWAPASPLWGLWLYGRTGIATCVMDVIFCLFQSWTPVIKPGIHMLPLIFPHNQQPLWLCAYFSDCLRFNLEILILGSVCQSLDTSLCFHVCPWFFSCYFGFAEFLCQLECFGLQTEEIRSKPASTIKSIYWLK